MKALFRGWIGLATLVGLVGVVSAAPVTWTLHNVVFSDGGSASGTFVFDADAGTPCSSGSTPCGVFSSVHITTTTGSSLTGTTYSFVCGQVATCTGVSPASTQVLFLTSNASNQTGLRAIAFFFTAAGPLPPAGLTDAGTTIDVSNGSVGAVQEAACPDATCSAPSGSTRSSVSGTVSITPVTPPATPAPPTWLLLLTALPVIAWRAWRTSNRRRAV